MSDAVTTTGWDYQASVEKVRPMVMKWRNLTIEIVAELYRAREELSKPGARTDLVTNGTRSWQGYLNDVGLNRMTVHRWLERYEPTERRIMEPEEVEERKRIAERAAQEAGVARRKRVYEAITTGKKPADWDDATEREYQHELREREAREERIAEAKRKAEEEHRAREERRTRQREDMDLLGEAAERLAEQTAQRQEFKQRIRLSQSGESDAFIDALMDYLDELEDDNRRIEACQNIIKVCRNVAVQLQQVGV